MEVLPSVLTAFGVSVCILQETTSFLKPNMVPQPFSALPAVRKQDLLVQFSSLKVCRPQGVFMSLTPGDVTLWSGVIFVRKGPYAPAILRFQISFPPQYPALPPLVTFATDIFHPLVTPLTTYMYTTDIQDTGTVSATDEERLPPGGFSLRHGFPHWFGRASRRAVGRSTPSGGGSIGTPGRSVPVGSDTASPESDALGSSNATPGLQGDCGRPDFGIFEVLRYIRSSFDDETVLDSVPLEAAGNPGAWHAWNTHQTKLGKHQSLPTVTRGPKTDSSGSVDVNSSTNSPKTRGSPPASAKRPGEWNWDGVWEIRVRKGVENSISEAVLFGQLPGDDLIRFLNMQKDEVETIKENIKRSADSLAGENSRKSLGG